jgi:F-type H+-transporting ATPase subunit epsilon
MKTFNLVVSTPNGNIFEGGVSKISLMGCEGSLSVMAGHIPFVTPTKAGQIKITNENGEETVLTVTEGLLTVSKDKTVLLCSPK